MYLAQGRRGCAPATYAGYQSTYFLHFQNRVNGKGLKTKFDFFLDSFRTGDVYVSRVDFIFKMAIV